MHHGCSDPIIGGSFNVVFDRASRAQVSDRRRSLVGFAISALALRASGAAFSDPITGQRTFAASAFRDSVGMCVHLENRQTPYYSNFEKVIQLLKDIGITHLRDDAIVASYVDREYDFYKKIRVLVGLGFRFDLVAHDPLNEYVFTPPKKLQEIYDWCDHGIEIFEGANEPNLARNPARNPAISADHQRSIYATVKNSPSLKGVVVASPSYIQKSVPIAENLADAVDWINLHPYPGMEHPETKGSGDLSRFVADAERTFGKSRCWFQRPVIIPRSRLRTDTFPCPKPSRLGTCRGCCCGISSVE